MLSEKTKEKSERIIIIIAILSFLLHLGLIVLVHFDLLSVEDPQKLLQNPIAATYTPFSFILFYEVYLLVYYLPKSITVYIGKQYEIITLIVIRRIFKDLANLELSNEWFQLKYDLQFTYDLLGSLVLFFLIYLFYRLNQQRLSEKTPEKVLPSSVQQFIRIKNILSLILAPIFFGLALYSIGIWVYESFFSVGNIVENIRDINQYFFDDFFTVLILTDVLLLLFSFIQTDNFRKVMRNSGFVISTILIKLSFGTDGLLNILLIVSALVFGVLILYIHNLYGKTRTPSSTADDD